MRLMAYRWWGVYAPSTVWYSHSLNSLYLSVSTGGQYIHVKQNGQRVAATTWGQQCCSLSDFLGVGFNFMDVELQVYFSNCFPGLWPHQIVLSAGQHWDCSRSNHRWTSVPSSRWQILIVWRSRTTSPFRSAYQKCSKKRKKRWWCKNLGRLSISRADSTLGSNFWIVYPSRAQSCWLKKDLCIIVTGHWPRHHIQTCS